MVTCDALDRLQIRAAAAERELKRMAHVNNDACDEIWDMRQTAFAAYKVAVATGAADAVVAALRELAGPMVAYAATEPAPEPCAVGAVA